MSVLHVLSDDERPDEIQRRVIAARLVSRGGLDG
jgi:hypothetical protein